MHAVIFLLLLVTLAESFQTNNGYEAINKSPEAELVNLDVGAGWYPFTFTNVGSRGSCSFAFTTTVLTILKVTDAFCPGDAFAIYDNKVLLGVTPNVANYCANKTPEPSLAFSSVGWSNGHWYLPPGAHLIEIVMTSSPWTAGSAYLRVDYNWNS